MSNSSKEDIPILKVTKILKRPTNLVNTNQTEESRLREPSKVTKTKDFSIAMIGAATFQTVAHQKDTQLFSITMSELDKQLTVSKDGVQLSETSEMTEDEQKDLRTKMPKEFHDFLDVFNKKVAKVLLPNWTYNHKIEIDSDGLLPKSWLYPISQFKLEKTKEYLEENLREGFITPSKTPYASPILFAQKSNGDLQFYIDY